MYEITDETSDKAIIEKLTILIQDRETRHRNMLRQTARNLKNTVLGRDEDAQSNRRYHEEILFKTVALSLTGCIESGATSLFATFLYQKEQVRKNHKENMMNMKIVC